MARVDSELRSEPTYRESIGRLPGSFWVLFTGQFINTAGNLIGVYMILWVKELGYSTPSAGVAVALYGLGSAASGVVGGTLSDRTSPRFTIILSLLLAAITALAFTQINTLEAIYVISPIAGLTGMFRPAARAMIGEIVSREDQLVGQGFYVYAANVGFVVSGVLGGFLAAESFNLVFLIDAVSSLVFAGIALLWLPSGKHVGAAQEAGSKVGLVGVLKKDHAFVLFLVAFFLGSFAFAQWISGIPLQVEANGHSIEFFGVLWSASALWLLLLQIPLLAFINHYPKLVSFAVSAVVVGIGAACYVISGTQLAMLFAASVMTFGEIVMMPTAYAYAAEVAPPGMSGRYQGAASTSFFSAFFVGPIVGSLIFSLDSAMLWVFCLVLCCVGALMALAVYRRDRERVTGPVAEVVTEESA